MTTFNIRIKELRLERGYSLRELAVLCNVSKSAIDMYEKGQRKPKYETLEALADIFNVDMEYLLGKSDVRNRYANMLGFDSLEEAYKAGAKLPSNIHPISTVSLPLLGNVACGEPIFAEENVESYIDAEEGTQADFCLRVKGDSMINARIFDGDIIFVKKQDIVDDGEIAVVLIEDEATVKRVYYDRENNVLTLVPENPTYKPMRYTGSELDTVRILGKVLSGQYRVL